MSGNEQAGPRRLALLGLSGSGKTSLLAALAMPRLAHPQGLEAAYGRDRDSGEATQGSAGTEADENLKRAISQIEKGRLPVRTTGGAEQAPLHYTLSAPIGDGSPSSPSRMDFAVEVFDYPGDLLISSADQQEAEVLATRLRDAEGFFFLVEVSPEQRESERRRALRTRLLERIQAHLTGKPIAVLLIQWDRLHSAQSSRPIYGASNSVAARPVLDPVNEARSWLSSTQGQHVAEFVASLRKISGPENVAAFAASGLGEVIRRTEVYRSAEGSVYRIRTAGASFEEDASSNASSRIIYVNREGRSFDVETLNLEKQMIEFRDSSGLLRSVAFEEHELSQTAETRVNLILVDGKPALASFGLEDAFVWLAQLCDQFALAHLRTRLAKIGSLSLHKSLFSSGKDAADQQDAKSVSPTAALIQAAQHLALRVPTGSPSKAETQALIERTIKLRRRHIGTALALGLTLLFSLGLGTSSLVDANWAAHVRDRATRLETTDIPTQLRDAQDISAYLDSSWRYGLAHALIWTPDEARTTRDKIIGALDRKLYEAVAQAARKTVRDFLDAAQRRQLGETIEAYRRISPAGAMRPSVDEIHRRLVELEQTITVTGVEFHVLTPGFLGDARADAYDMRLVIEKTPPSFERKQYKRVTIQSSVPTALQDAKLAANRQISRSLLRPMDLELCYWEEAGADILKKDCTITDVDLIAAASVGKAVSSRAGPLEAIVNIELAAESPDIPAYHK